MSPLLADAPPPYRTVVFDCDSTLSKIEGIEELAGELLSGELKRLTQAAMDGRVALEDVYGLRLERVRPDRAALERIAALYIEHRLPHVEHVVRALRFLGKRVVIVSGGLRPAVAGLARFLGITEVEAVDVSFAPDGSYAGFDTASPLARSGGKIEVLERIAAAGHPVVLVGDGATDLEAAHLAARFVAFGGVVRRECVFDTARVKSVSADFAALLPLLASEEEVASLRSEPDFDDLFGAL